MCINCTVRFIKFCIVIYLCLHIDSLTKQNEAVQVLLNKTESNLQLKIDEMNNTELEHEKSSRFHSSTVKKIASLETEVVSLKKTSEENNELIENLKKDEKASQEKFRR